MPEAIPAPAPAPGKEIEVTFTQGDEQDIQVEHPGSLKAPEQDDNESLEHFEAFEIPKLGQDQKVGAEVIDIANKQTKRNPSEEIDDKAEAA